MDDLERLLAERACERLIVEYCRLVDFGEAAGIAELFTEDGVWESADLVMDGKAQILAGFSRRQGVTRRLSRHLCTNVAVDVTSSEEATSLCYLVNYRHDQEGPRTGPAPVELPKFVGEYHDRFVRTAEGWRFAHRRADLGFVRHRAASAPLE